MRDRKTTFVLLTRHTDEELTDYIQKKAEQGWRLKSVKGNLFTFKRQKYDGKRLCSYSFLARTPDSPTEVQLRRELPFLRHSGWDTIAIGGPENIADTRRHAFLYEEHEASSLPASEEGEEAKALKRGKRKMRSNLVISLIYLAFFSILLSVDIIRLSSSLAYILSALLFSLLLFFSLFLSFRTLLSYKVEKKHHDKYIRKSEYRYLDYSTAFIFISLLIFILFLTFDFFYGDASRGGERIKMGDISIRVHSDEIPITLSDLGLPYGGEVRTSVHKQKRSPFASYSYSYEQYFGTDASSSSYISYTFYESGISFLRSMASRELIRSPLSLSEELSSSLGYDVFSSSAENELLIRLDEALFYVRTAEPLDDYQIKKLLDFFT